MKNIIQAKKSKSKSTKNRTYKNIEIAFNKSFGGSVGTNGYVIYVLAFLYTDIYGGIPSTYTYLFTHSLAYYTISTYLLEILFYGIHIKCSFAHKIHTKSHRYMQIQANVETTHNYT